MDRSKKAGIDQGSHNGIDYKNLLNSTGKLVLIIPDLGTDPDSIGRNSKGSSHGKIGYGRSDKRNPAIAFRKKYSGDIRKGNYREKK